MLLFLKGQDMKWITAFIFLLIVAGSASATDEMSKFKNRSSIYAMTCKSALGTTERNRRAQATGAAGLETLARGSILTAECYSYIDGFIDGRNSGGAKQFCIPDDVDHIQIAELVVKTAEENPEIRATPKQNLIEFVLKSNWPCTKSGT